MLILNFSHNLRFLRLSGDFHRKKSESPPPPCQKVPLFKGYFFQNVLGRNLIYEYPNIEKTKSGVSLLFLILDKSYENSFGIPIFFSSVPDNFWVFDVLI